MVERALFVIGGQSAGKSHCLRAMFWDHRFQKGGRFRNGRGQLPLVRLSRERRLRIVLSSPQEKGWTIQEYFDVIGSLADGRWCFAGALQAGKSSSGAGRAREVIEAFVAHYAPERVRACVLSPDFAANTLPRDNIERSLRRIHNTETCSFDATADSELEPFAGHGLFLADFFDFA